MGVIIDTPELKITTQPDSTVEPGHQWIIISNTAAGRGLASVLSSRLLSVDNHTAPSVGMDITGDLRLAHDHDVDEMLMVLVDLAAEIRVSAPDLVQLKLRL
jgi:hypothetical protein